MSPPKEQPQENPYSDIDELNEAIDFPESEGKVIPIRIDKREELSPEVLKLRQQELIDLNKHLKDIEYMEEGFALMKKRDKRYAELKIDLKRELKALPELQSRREELERQVLSPDDISEQKQIRSKELTRKELAGLDEKALAKVREKLKKEEKEESEEEVLAIEKFLEKDKALVPQPKQEVEKHKDWGAWRNYEDPYPWSPDGQPSTFLYDIVDWSKRKIKRLMGKGAELDEGKEEQAIEINLEKTLAEQTKFYKDTLNLEIDEDQVRSIWNQNYAEIKSEVAKYGYDNLLIIPDNLPTVAVLNQKLIETMEETKGGQKKKVTATYQGDSFKQGGSFNGVKSSYSSGYRLVLTHQAQNLADHPLLKATQGKNVMEVTGLDQAEVNRRLAAGQELPVDCELLINGQKIEIKAEGESLEEYILRQRLYFDQTGHHLDEKGWTWLLKSSSGSRVVDSGWNLGGRRLGVDADGPGNAGGRLGLRLSRSFKLT